MKSLTFSISVLLLSLGAFAKSPKAQLDEALKRAQAEKKDLLVVFSGPTWNNTSKEFEKDVLQNPEFQKESGKTFMPLLIEIPATRKEAHEDLLEFEKTFQFQTIPTVILMDQQGRPYAITVPEQKDQAGFLSELGKLQQIRVERDKLFESALKIEGKGRAESLVKALKTLPQQLIVEFYGEELEMIAKADPGNETVYVGEIRKAEALKKEQERFNKLFAERKYDEIIKQAQAEGAKLKGEDAQRLMLYGVKALFAKKEYDQALKEVEALKKIDPNSDLGKRSEQFAAQLNAAKKRQERIKEEAMKPRKPVVSKPVAIVTDVEILRKDVAKAEEEYAQAQAKQDLLVKERDELAKEISRAETKLEALRKKEKASADALKMATEEREKMARKAKTMKEVLENHIAMEKRKREVSELEKKAAELQKQAEELRKKADKVRKGK